MAQAPLLAKEGSLLKRHLPSSTLFQKRLRARIGETSTFILDSSALPRRGIFLKRHSQATKIFRPYILPPLHGYIQYSCRGSTASTTSTLMVTSLLTSTAFEKAS